MLPKRIKDQLQEITELGPLDVAGFGVIQIGPAAALRILEGEEIYCVIETLVGAGMQPHMIRNLLQTDGTETHQFAGQAPAPTSEEQQQCSNDT